MEKTMYDKFKNNLIETKELFGGVQKLFKFDNMYGASVIKHKYSYGGDKGLWELAVIKYQDDDKWHIDYDTKITDDVIGYLTDEDVCFCLEQIKHL